MMAMPHRREATWRKLDGFSSVRLSLALPS